MRYLSPILFMAAVLAVASAENRLLLVQTVWSPGSHSPIVSLPSEKENVINSWPDGLGALTEAGVRQSLELGAQLRRRYIRGFQLFDGSLNRQMYVASSNVDLALTSAAAVMAGLQGNGNDTSNWRPFPIHVEEEQSALAWNTECPQADAIENHQTRSSPWFQSKSNLNFIKQIVGRAGYRSFEGPGQLYSIWDALDSMRQNDHPMPIWGESEDIDRLKGLLDVSSALSYSQDIVARLRGGRLLELIVKKIKSKIACMAKDANVEECANIVDQRMHAYSTDDLTLYALLGTLGAVPSVIQAPASAVAIELWRNLLGNLEIKVVTKTSADGEFTDVLVSDCPDLICDVQKFLSRSDRFISGNWQAECGMEPKFELEESPVHPDCFDVKDRSDSKNCIDWASADYCENQIAVKYLFCRQTCLCNPRFAKRRRTQ
uniref:acid phosphatase n=1 Tax=Plectus sambesii TaxID=2011161 RepID=A0A914X0Z5_9BILA